MSEIKSQASYEDSKQVDHSYAVVGLSSEQVW